MICQLSSNIAILGVSVRFVSVLTILIAFAAPSQPSAKSLSASGVSGTAVRVTPRLSQGGRAERHQSVGGLPGQTQTFTAPYSGDSLFLPVVTYSSGGTYAFSIAVADMDGDGNQDLAVANCNPKNGNTCEGAGEVGVLLGNGDGTFRPVVTYGSGGAGAHSIVAADVNGDGKQDLLVANRCGSTDSRCLYNGSVGVLLGKGNGTFWGAVTYDSGGTGSTSIAVADVNADGNLDLIVTPVCTNSICGAGVLLGNGDGTFRLAATQGSFGGVSVAVADVNQDGRPDLLLATTCIDLNCASGSVAVLLGNGDGTFQAAVAYSSGGKFPYSIAVADVNGDGRLDLAVSNLCVLSDTYCTGSANGRVGVLLGNGDGTFQPVVTYDSGGLYAISVAISDINGDGKSDLLVGNRNSGNIGLLLGNGDGTFQPAVTYDSGGPGGPNSITVADLNGDGHPDVLAANTGTVGVLLNSGFTQAPTTTSVTSSLNPSVVGQAVTFTATVSSSAGTPPNGETITFKNGSTVLGTAPLSGGMASLTTSSLSAGTDTITASYPGDSKFAASTSPGLRQVVNSTTKSATTTTFVSSLNPSIYGQKITWTATVTTTGSVPPTGTVSFTWSDGFRTFNIGSATLNSGGVATLTRSNLNADPYPLTAKYQGDANNLTSTSPILNQTVLQATSAATITSSPNPSILGQAVTFTAQITSPTVTPAGPVTFTTGKTVLGTAQLTRGKATLTISSLPAGSSVVTATFAGDSNIKGSSAVVTQIVQ